MQVRDEKPRYFFRVVADRRMPNVQQRNEQWVILSQQDISVDLT